MYLSEALTKLKNLKSKAARVEGYINACAVHYEDDKPEHNYLDECKVREELNAQILELKTRIQLTNAQTSVSYRGDRMTLSQLILTNAALRAEMAFVAKQMGHTATSENIYSSRSKDDIKKVLAEGCSKPFFKAQLDALEAEKEELERVMAAANASTTLV